MSDLIPTFRISTLPQGRFKLIELSVAHPSIGAIAIILDVSDSCAPMTEDLRRLPKLLALRPRRTPVWVYHMSGTRPLIQEQLTVGHIVDRTADPERWLPDRELMSELKLRGTLLRPAMESIQARCAAEGVTRVTVVAMTDGEILDADPISAPSNIMVVGLVAEQQQEKLQHWRRVMGATPLCRLGDAALDAAIRGDASPFYGLCKIQFEPSAPGVVLRRFDRARGALIPLNGTSLEWNFVDGPLHVCASHPAAEVDAIDISCTSERYLTRARFSSTAAAAPIADEVLEACIIAVDKRPCDSTSIIVDSGFGQKDFEEIWREAGRAADLADRRERWVDASGRLVVFTNDVSSAVTPAQALLCVCNGDPRSSASKESRVILIGVRKAPRPAIAWTNDRRPDFVRASGDIVLDYEPLESRWMLRCGTEVSELNPRGSQHVRLEALQSVSGGWFAFFSGDITQA